jgi:hypothetical protein
MCPKEGRPVAAAWAFDARTKCCTYMPELPSFLVGRILEEEPGPGRASVEARIDARAGVTPLGLFRPPSYEALWKSAAPGAQGRVLALRCPHFVEETGLCGIWRNRNHACATWFCKHSRGAAGYAMKLAVRDLLQAIEVGLARWCALELGIDARVLRSLIARGEKRAETFDGRALDDVVEDHAAVWGAWAGRERAFYVECARKVSGLAWNDVRAKLGPEVEVFARAARAEQERLASTELPARLRPGSFQLLGVRSDGVSAISYSPFDPIGLPAPLLGILHYFDGRPTTDAFRAIAEERGIRLDDALVRKLIDWKILLPG